jgi:phosphate transport system permease protein
VKKRIRLSDEITKWIIWFSAFFTTAVLVCLIVYIMIRGVPHISWEFLTQQYKPSGTHGIFGMIATTVYIIGLTLLFAAPVGVFAAVYLVEYARPGRLVKAIEFATESLAGIPSILYGLFGFILFVRILGFKFSLLSGALTLSLTILPTIIRTTQESLKPVPVAYKEGSLALGATRLSTLFKIILPSALPGIITALILSVGRIVGETAAVFITAGVVYRMPGSIMDSGRTLAVHLYTLANEGSSVLESDATAAVLVIVVLLINLLSNAIGNTLMKKLKGA